VEIASVLELRARENTFKVVAEVGLGPLAAGARVPHGPAASSQASFTVRREQAVVVDDYAQEARFAQSSILSDWGVRSALSVQVPGNPEPFGVLETASRTRRAFDADDGSFLTAVAHLLADALERSRSEDEMRQLALHDPLTGLANRRVLFDRLTLALARAARGGTRLAVLFLDIDHFKLLNDTLGHLAGDQLLCDVGARIATIMRAGDTAARFGGDEFVLLCEDLNSEDEAEAWAARVHTALAAPFSFDGEQRSMRFSIGVALSDADHHDGESLVRDADAALYRSKRRGRGTWTLATDEMRTAGSDGQDPVRTLERGIENGELFLHYQPIITLDDGGLCGVEALVRWADPERGLILPGDFIALAEQSGLILRLGEWVLRAACAQAASWREEFGGRAPLPMHVNFSARQLSDADLPETVRTIVEAAGVPRRDIVIEITESGLIEASEAPIAAISKLRSMGFRVVLDDFGTGYSSLSYLTRFRIDALKIDRTFVDPLGWPTASAPIVTAIVGMARGLALETVAEGVETAEQAAAVAALGCDCAQGYYFARPAPAEEIARLVRDDTQMRERAAQAMALVPAALRRRLSQMRSAGGHAADPASVATHRASFFSALLAADMDAADDVVYSALRDHVPPATVDARIIGPAMVEVGRLWELGEVSVAQQHLASEIASQSAGRVASASTHLQNELLAPLTGQTALLANVEGDEHDLGLHMAADTLRSLGADVLQLGGRLPHDELCAASAQMRPDIIGFSLTLPELGRRLEEQIDALRGVCPNALVLLGGQGVTPELVERTAATFVESVEDLAGTMGTGQRVLPASTGLNEENRHGAD
jgi:diguanylate cyclase (GGDEF)-like protein